MQAHRDTIIKTETFLVRRRSFFETRFRYAVQTALNSLITQVDLEHSDPPPSLSPALLLVACATTLAKRHILNLKI